MDALVGYGMVMFGAVNYGKARSSLVRLGEVWMLRFGGVELGEVRFG